MRNLLRVCVGFGILLGACTASAQTTAGIAGVVRDASGAVMPGVTVEASSPALIEKVRTAVTDDNGNYKITDLRPGVYTVTFTIPGFATFRREAVELSAGFTAAVNAEMKIGSVEETVTVTGASPIVDVQNVRTQQVLRAEVLEALPSGLRDMSQFISLTLGATTDSGRNDVGGDKGELSTGIQIHGSRGDDARTNYDGMNTNVFYGGGGGMQRIYKFNTVGVAETVLDTGGNSAETETGGANVNMVPKDGGNTFSLTGLFSYTNEDLASANVPDSLIARGSRPNQNTMKKVYDYGVGAGGPLAKDRLWFYSANRWWGNEAYAADNFFNKSTVFHRYEADLARPAFSDQDYKDYGVRLTWQATAKHKLTGFVNWQEACACWMGIGGATAPESSTSFIYGPMWLNQYGWNYPATNKLLLQAGASFLFQAVQFTSQGGPNVPGRLPITDVGRGYTWGGLLGSPLADNGDPQNQNNFNERVTVSYITGSHAFKTGLQMQQGNFNTRGNMPGDLPGVSYQFNSGVPFQLTQYAVPFRNDARLRATGIFAQDQWTIDRLTLNLGVRYDHFTAYTLDVRVPAGPFIGERFYAGVTDLPTFSDITPRIGAAYDVFGNGRTAVKGSWGRYLLGMGAGGMLLVAPANAAVNSATRPWNDSTFGAGDPRTANFVPDCDLRNFDPNGECGVISNRAFGQPVVNLVWDESSRTGWNQREYNYQYSVGLQHELRPGFGITVAYFRTDWRNQRILHSESTTLADFTPYCVPTPTDPRLADFSGKQVCGLFDINASALARFGRNQVLKMAEDVPGRNGMPSEVYNGVDFSFNLRFADRGLLQGGVGVGRLVTDNCYANEIPNTTRMSLGQYLLPFSNRTEPFCVEKAPLWSGSGSQIKLQAVYPLPWDFTVSGSYKHLPGIPVSATLVVPNAVVRQSLGRDLAFCLGAPVCNQVVSVPIVAPGALYDDRLNQIDLRFTRMFRISRSRLQGSFEVYNLTNGRPAQSVLTTYTPPGTTSRAWLTPASILGGRLFKFGAQIDW